MGSIWTAQYRDRERKVQIKTGPSQHQRIPSGATISDLTVNKTHNPQILKASDGSSRGKPDMSGLQVENQAEVQKVWTQFEGFASKANVTLARQCPDGIPDGKLTSSNKNPTWGGF